MVAGVACGGITELTVQAPGAVGVYANIDGAGWEQLTATGSDASYSFDVYSTYEVGEQCLNPDPSGSNLPPQPYSYEVLATVDDDESPLQLLACGSLPAPLTPLTLDVEMQQPGTVYAGYEQSVTSATGPWTATFQVAAARYDIAATDGTRVAVVRDVNVDADTTVTIDLDTDGTELETFPVTVSSALPTLFQSAVTVLYVPDSTVRDVLSPTVGWVAEFGSDGIALAAALPPSGLERTDAQLLSGLDVLEGTVETAQTASLDSHNLQFLPLPQFNVGNGRLAGAAIGSASTVAFTIVDTALNQSLGAVWMTRRWLDSTSNPSEAAFDNSFPAFYAPTTEVVVNLWVCQQANTETVCAN
jgi:hypothetical protein